METKEENKIQEAQIIPETKIEKPMTQTLGAILENKSTEPIKESTEALAKAKVEEVMPEVAVESTEKAVDAFSDLGELEKETLAKKTKSEFRSRLLLIFVLGFLIGIALKTEALKKITIGYSDYLMKIKPQSYDINGVQTKLQSERDAAAQTQAQQDNTANTGNANDSGSVNDSGSAPTPDSGDQGGAANNQAGN